MEDMKKAYKKKALIHHPDRNGGVQSDEFLRLKQAYDNLIDPAKRRNYDAFHHTGEFKKEGRPLSAKEAAWLVDQQKRSWGVKEIHPFAVCILCDSCPCPADGVCDGCGMTYCQLCVRKMHCRGGMTPHYPLKTSTKFSEDLAKQGKEKEREHKLLKGNTNQWLMHDVDFRNQRDVYNHRAKREAPEMCWYWAWGQTRYTVHLAMWLASEDHDADIQFSVTEEGRQRIQVTPNGQPQLLDRVMAYEVNTSRSGEAFAFGSMHCMSFVMLKAHPGQRWRKLFDGDSEGLRELPLGEPPHSVLEDQVEGFKPANHYRVAGRKDTESEWYEITINVPIPEAAERKHVSVVLEGDRLAVRVAGWMDWHRRIQARTLRWEDKHESRTHVDMHNSTWLMTRDEERDFKCVQFVLSEWQEGSSKNQESDIRRQLTSTKARSCSRTRTRTTCLTSLRRRCSSAQAQSSSHGQSCARRRLSSSSRWRSRWTNAARTRLRRRLPTHGWRTTTRTTPAGINLRSSCATKTVARWRKRLIGGLLPNARRRRSGIWRLRISRRRRRRAACMRS